MARGTSIPDLAQVKATRLKRGFGSIVNMSSVASSVKGASNRFSYGASKDAVIGVTKAIAADYVTKGIRCNALCPGTMETPSLKQRIASFGDIEIARAAFDDEIGICTRIPQEDPTLLHRSRCGDLARRMLLAPALSPCRQSGVCLRSAPSA